MPKDEDELGLGRLKRVDVRAYWPDEARDFTPWLARHIDLLSEAIGGLDLEVEEQEGRVGSFRVDLVCRDMDGRLVIVENQFGRTNHDHLGKLLTYAGGKDATVIVWVAEDFTDEHRAALDWLNEHTDRDVHVFGVQIELWKIGDSAPAPRFNVVSKPNVEMPEALRLNFWTDLRVVMQQNQRNVVPGAPSRHPWMCFYAFGRDDFWLEARVDLDRNRIGVRLVMSHARANGHYHLLYEQKDDVEREIGRQLEWREIRIRCNVTLWRANCDMYAKDQWGDFHGWLHEYLEKFYAAFSARIKELPDAQDEDDA